MLTSCMSSMPSSPYFLALLSYHNRHFKRFSAEPIFLPHSPFLFLFSAPLSHTPGNISVSHDVFSDHSVHSSCNGRSMFSAQVKNMVWCNSATEEGWPCFCLCVCVCFQVEYGGVNYSYSYLMKLYVDAMHMKRCSVPTGNCGISWGGVSVLQTVANFGKTTIKRGCPERVSEQMPARPIGRTAWRSSQSHCSCRYMLCRINRGP